jgi:hypothetical protein
LEKLQQEVSEPLDCPSEPCHIDDVISGTNFDDCNMTAQKPSKKPSIFVLPRPSLLEEPSEIVQGKSEEVQIQKDAQDTHGKWWLYILRCKKIIVAKSQHPVLNKYL